MKPPVRLLLPILIPALLLAGAAGCSSTSDEADDGEGEPAEPVSIAGVTGQAVRVEWRNLSTRRQDPPLGLVNRSSPEFKELYRKPAAYNGVKPIEDEEMQAVLDALREVGFFDHAQKGPALETFRPGPGQHGVVHLRTGDENWALVFAPGMGESELPEVYRNSKLVIFEFHRRTMWLQPSAPQDPDRVFRVPTGPVPRR